MLDRRTFARLFSLAAAAAAIPPRLNAAPASRKLLKPKRLQEGDTVGMVLPASAVWEADNIALAREQLEALGFKVVLGRHVFDRHGYFAGTDQDRAADVNRMFADDSIDGIFCYTGGWGSPRILPLIDYALIARKPKVIVGFSDITALLNAIYQRTGLVTFHGPVAAVNFEPYTLEHFRRVVMTAEPAGLLNPPDKRAVEVIDRNNRILRLAPGKASGPLVGGNLTMVASLMGTPFEIDTRGALLFAEDVNEEIYRVDRMLTQLALAGKFEQMAGLAFGRCSRCNMEGRTFSLEDILRHHFGGGKPAISGLSFGHIEQKMTFPIGITATLDADGGTLSLDEAAVV
ncbi:MAG TPA: LD-carboxypeptidase [Thermoanaerobaculia bacterium]